MGYKEGESSLSGFSDADQGALKVLGDMVPAIGFVSQEHGSITMADLRPLQGAGGAPAFDLWQETGSDPLPPEVTSAALTYLDVYGQAAEPEERSAVEEADRIIREPIEIVDVAKIEEEKRERRRQQNREAQRRWRKNHPEKHYTDKQRWRQNPDVRAREAAAARERYRRKKTLPQDPNPFT